MGLPKEAPFCFAGAMDAPSLLRLGFSDLHREIREDVADLGDDELFWQPADGQNHIGFLLWHLVRDEDTVLSQAVLSQPELWAAGGWFERFGMDAREQGTGMERERLAEFRYPLPLLLEYADATWARTDRALGTMPPERLDEALPWSTDWRLANLLLTGCLNHGWVHLGEIRGLRGLRGWRFRE